MLKLNFNVISKAQMDSHVGRFLSVRDQLLNLWMFSTVFYHIFYSILSSCLVPALFSLSSSLNPIILLFFPNYFSFYFSFNFSLFKISLSLLFFLLFSTSSFYFTCVFPHFFFFFACPLLLYFHLSHPLGKVLYFPSVMIKARKQNFIYFLQKGKWNDTYFYDIFCPCLCSNGQGRAKQ